MVESAAETSLELNDHGNDGAVTVGVVMVSGDSSRKSFDPEKVIVPVGAKVVWELRSDVMPGGHGSGGVMPDGNGNGNGNAGPVSESFHLRGDIPIYDNGFVTECEFSLGDSNNTFSHVFQQEGLFIMCSKISPSDDGKKRGEVCVYNTTTLTSTSKNDNTSGEILVERTENLCQSQGDSSSFDPDSTSADLEGFPSENEDSSSSGSHALIDEGRQRSTPTHSDVSQLNSPTGSNCPAGDQRSSGSDARDARGTPLIESDVKLRGLSATGVPARPSVANTTHPELHMDKAILAATAAATVGQAKSVAESLRISLAGRYRGLPPLVGVHATGDDGMIGIGDGLGRPLGGEGVLGRVNQKTSGGTSSFTEPLFNAVVVSPRRSSRTPDVLSTSGTSEQEDQCNEGSIGGVSSGCGTIKSDSHRSLDDTDFDGDNTTHLEAAELEPVPRVDAAVQSGELLSPPNNANDKATPDATTQQQLVASANTPISAEEKSVVAAIGESQESEQVGHDTTDNLSSKSKKKKSKKKKKKSGGGGSAGGNGGVGGDGRGGGGGESGGKGWNMRHVSGPDAAKVGGDHQNDSALLIDEQSFSYLFIDHAVGAREGGNGKSVAKTLIVGDQGFKPTKALMLQAGAAVSIKVASVRRNRVYGQDRALSISLEIPIVHTLEVRVI